MFGAVSAFLCGLVPSAPAQADKFQTCVKSFWPAAKRAGVSWDTFEQATAGITLDKEVIESANYQPEYKKPIGEYVDRAVSPKRLEKGKEKLVEYKALLDQLEAKYGVDRHIVVAIWGVESNYGDNPGDKNVIQSLMTLACSGTKAKFARGQIVSALKILQRGDVTHRGDERLLGRRHGPHAIHSHDLFGLCRRSGRRWAARHLGHHPRRARLDGGLSQGLQVDSRPDLGL